MGPYLFATQVSVKAPGANPVSYRYTFIMGANRRRTFELNLDPETLGLIPAGGQDSPDWTRLECCQCPNCPLSTDTHFRCPIAVSITELVGFFGHVASYDQLDVEIAADERSYVKRTATSEAVSSLLGMYMVTSGCPVMDKLRPMVRFHLPLATSYETTFRAVAMYLVAQYFVQRDGGEPDWSLDGLRHIYTEVQTVNGSFAKRINRATDNDASVNAIVRLDALASAVVMCIDMEHLNVLKGMFAAYLSPAE